MNVPLGLKEALADRYALHRELGAGGMATVYLADDLKHHRQVALKVLRPELSATLGHERFIQEIETTASLRHPHILPLYDSGEEAGFLFYVMPLVEGESLRDRLAREKQLPLDDALRIAREVSDALGYAHARGLVHRDIKPENILLEGGHAVVADFGIARAVRVAGGEKLTETGISLGTPTYMSPEQAAGERDIDGRSDLYALGCVVYEMLAGQPPFTGPTIESITRQHLLTPPPPVTNLRPAVPAGVMSALQRALAKNPADRFSSVAPFAEALRTGEGAFASAPPSTSPVVTGPFRFRRTVVVSGVLLVAAAASWQLWWRGAASAPVDCASVAVLPFADLSPDRTSVYLGDGMAETLISALGRVDGLNVAARTSAFSFRGRSGDVREIGRQLGVCSVLEGSVQRVSDKLRVTAQLTKASDGLHLWSDTFDRSAGDIFVVQDEVARAVVAALTGKLLGRADSLRTSDATRSTAAYDSYLLGRFYWNQRTTTGVTRAAEYFQAALRADSNYALAWAGLSDSYLVFGPEELDVPDIDRDSVLALGERAARRAIEISPRLGEAYTSLAFILLKRQRWDESGSAFREGLALSPRYPTAHQWYAHWLMVMNRWDEAARELERARELDPMSFIIAFSLAVMYDAVGRVAEATPVYDRALALAPEHASTLRSLFVHELMQGRFAQGAAVYRRFLLATGADTASATLAERQLGDSTLRPMAVARIAQSAEPYLGLSVQRVINGDDAAIAYLASLAKSPRRRLLNDAALFTGLGPRLQVHPRVQAILVELGYPASGSAAVGR